ncbi:hypothetical protein QFZ67_007466 [Streptomyces sp. V1I1]|nr:hypothetical protein [Streptomyces sp. V1I1]
MGVNPGRYRVIAIMADNAVRGPSWQMPDALQLVVCDEAVASWKPAQWSGLKPPGIEEVLNGYPVESWSGALLRRTGGDEPNKLLVGDLGRGALPDGSSLP